MSTNHKSYEAFYIVRPDLTDSEVQKIADKFKVIVTDNGGTVASAGKWDKRKLAYEIAGLKEGNYILMNFTAAPTVPAELNRLMRISDDVIRHMILADEKASALTEVPTTKKKAKSADAEVAAAE